jgi:uncharacterized protein YkwD
MKRRALLRASGASVVSGLASGCTERFGIGDDTTEQPTPCPMPRFDAVASDEYDRIEPFERAVFERVNESRRSQGIEPVAWDEVLAYISRLHSRNMARNGYLAHEDTSGRGPGDRISGFRYGCQHSFSENIFRIYRYYSKHNNDILSIGREAVAWWEESPPHRRAMWSEPVEVAGVGCYITRDNDIYVTNLFCTHDPADAEDAATGTPSEDCYYGGERP